LCLKGCAAMAQPFLESSKMNRNGHRIRGGFI